MNTNTVSLFFGAVVSENQEEKQWIKSPFFFADEAEKSAANFAKFAALVFFSVLLIL